MHRKCNYNTTAHIEQYVTEQFTFSGKWEIYKCISKFFYVMCRYTNGGVSYSPMYIHTFRFLYYRHLSENLKFIHENPTPENLITVSDKLKWYRLQNGLKQSDVAEAMNIDRVTYSRYEENVTNTFPLDNLSKAAELFKIHITELLDEYNLFLYHGQGKQIKNLRKSMKLTQSGFAKYMNVSLTTVKKWENEQVNISKISYYKLKKLLI